MIKSNTIVIGIYISITALVMIFVFGKSGLLDSMSYSQEIVDLVNKVTQSQHEIEEMTREYLDLVSMKTPNTAFLVGQGRKIENIVVFQQLSVERLHNDNTTAIEQEQQLFFTIALIALVILICGWIGIKMISYSSAKQKRKYQEGLGNDIV